MSFDEFKKRLQPFVDELMEMTRSYSREVSLWAVRQAQYLVRWARENPTSVHGLVKLSLIVGAFFCGASFLATIGSPPSITVLWHYLAGMIAVAVPAWFENRIASARWPRFRVLFRGTAIVAPFLAAFFWGRVDTYRHEWAKDDGTADNPNWIDVVDTRYRWSDRLIYQKIIFHRDGDYKERFEVEGPLSPSGKRHGEWKTHFWDWHLKDTSQFYWYGDEISEGEWHLRNR